MWTQTHMQNPHRVCKKRKLFFVTYRKRSALTFKKIFRSSFSKNGKSTCKAVTKEQAVSDKRSGKANVLR